MQITTSSESWKTSKNTCVLFVTQEKWQGQIRELNELLSNSVLSYLSQEQFKAEASNIHSVPAFGKLAMDRVLIIGLGKESDIDLQIIRKAGASLVRFARTHHTEKLAIDIDFSVFTQSNDKAEVTAFVEGLLLGEYRFDKYKKEKAEKKLVSVTLLTRDEKSVKNAIVEAEITSGATIFARDLINESPTITTPTFLAKEAEKLTGKGISVKIREKKEIEKLGMEAYLAVTRGSDEPPKFIELIYKNGPKKVVIVGKGITFDTGGLSLKDAKNMETMKLDMSGAAAVLGVFKAITKLQPKCTVIGLIAACENMPGAKAIKPGDIVTAMNGKSIEILNTDAEGRLTLADMLSYAVGENPDYIIDLATLTGACMVALGDEIAGLFSNDAAFAQELKKAAQIAGEKVWELPLEKEYKNLIKGDWADLQNTGKSRYGGAITAALFLEEFVDNHKWIHLDIAGPSFAEKDSALIPKGGVGFGVRMLLEWLQNYRLGK